MFSREDLLQPSRLDRLDEVDVGFAVFAALPVGELAVARERDENDRPFLKTMLNRGVAISHREQHGGDRQREPRNQRHGREGGEVRFKFEGV